MKYGQKSPRTRYWERQQRETGASTVREAQRKRMEELARKGETQSAASVAALLIAGDRPGVSSRKSPAQGPTAFCRLPPDPHAVPMAPIRHTRRCIPLAVVREEPGYQKRPCRKNPDRPPGRPWPKMPLEAIERMKSLRAKGVTLVEISAVLIRSGVSASPMTVGRYLKAAAAAEASSAQAPDQEAVLAELPIPGEE